LRNVAARPVSGNDAENVGFFHDQQLFAVDLDFVARPLAEQHAVADLSAEDLAYAEHALFPFPGAAQIVLSVLGGRVDESAIFEVSRATGTFAPRSGRLLEVDEE